MNLTVRDNDIGWTVDAVEANMARKQDIQKSNNQISQTEGKEASTRIERFLESEEEYIRRTEEYSEKLLTRLEANIKEALNDIYVKDLGYHRNTKHSSEEYIRQLRTKAEELRQKNLNNTKKDNVTDWVAEAESELFKKKRLIELYSERTLKQLCKIKELLRTGYKVDYIIVSLNPYVKAIELIRDTEFYKEFDECINLGMSVHAFGCRVSNGMVLLDKKLDLL